MKILKIMDRAPDLMSKKRDKNTKDGLVKTDHMLKEAQVEITDLKMENAGIRKQLVHYKNVHRFSSHGSMPSRQREVRETYEMSVIV